MDFQQEYITQAARNRKIDRDPRLIAARRKYRVDVKLRRPETEAWKDLKAILDLVANEQVS